MPKIEHPKFANLEQPKLAKKGASQKAHTAIESQGQQKKNRYLTVHETDLENMQNNNNNIFSGCLSNTLI